MASPRHLPIGRGFQTSLGYFGHTNWASSQREWRSYGKFGSENMERGAPGAYPASGPDVDGALVDLWDSDRPARHLNGTAHEEILFRQRILRIIRDHNPMDQPLFLEYSSRLVHHPQQPPHNFLERFASIRGMRRRQYVASVTFYDEQVRVITAEMKRLGYWNDTLIIGMSDNGGPTRQEGELSTACEVNPPNQWGHVSVNRISGMHPHRFLLPEADRQLGFSCLGSEQGASNFPLLGGKYTDFEGGIRVRAFVSGGFVPRNVRGTVQSGLLHLADWYATLCYVSGADPADRTAHAAGLPPIDSLNMWPLLSGASSTSPRRSVLVSNQSLLWAEEPHLWKYMAPGTYHGATQPSPPDDHTPLSNVSSVRCPDPGCLFDVRHDPGERHDVAHSRPVVVQQLSAELRQQAAGIWRVTHPFEGACRAFAHARWNGFLGPWLGVDDFGSTNIPFVDMSKVSK